MKRDILTIIFYITCLNLCTAQTTIYGNIHNPSLATVMAIDVTNDSILSYSSTKADGSYIISYDNYARETVKITVKGLEIRTMSRIVKNISQKLDFNATVEAQHIPEVVVRAKKIESRSDTITYVASAFLGKNDRVLKDLLKKMPGLSVGDDGKISFNGKWIKDFYIEGNDMLGDNYDIASSNLDAQSIASVQILQNHEDAKILQGKSMSDTPALNITLKNKAKGAIASDAEIALGGIPLARDINIAAMKFTEKKQNISFFKTNNIGKDLGVEMNAPMSLPNVDGIGVISPDDAPIDNSWSYRNDSYSTSVNQLFKIDNDRTLTFNINYLYDKQKQKSHSITDYYLRNDSSWIINEINQAANHMNFLGGNFVYKLNSRKLYFKNKSSINFNFSRVYDVLEEDTRDIDQRFNVNNFNFKNNFCLLTNTGVFGRSFTSDLSVNHTHTDLYLPDINQNFLHNRFSIKNSINFLTFNFSLFKIVLDGKVGGCSNHIMTDFLQKNNVSCQKYNALLSPMVMLFQQGKIQFTVNMPFGYKGYRFHTDMQHTKDNQFYFTPDAFIKFTPGSRWEIVANGSLANDYESPINFMDNMYVMDYRSRMKNDDLYSPGEIKKRSGVLTVDYKDIFKMFFGNVSFFVQKEETPHINGYDLDNNILFYHLRDTTQNISIYQLQQTLSKGFYRWNSKISETASIGYNRENYLVNDKCVKLNSRYLISSVDFTLQPFSWMQLNGQGKYSAVFPDRKQNIGIDRTLNCKLNIFVNLFRNISAKVESQYYADRYMKKTNDNVFMNLKVRWNLKKVDLTLTGLNIFNEDVYHQVNNLGIVRYVDDICLRGRTLLLGLHLKLF
ncbi:MAG: hypothetical protein LKI18_06970 [Prevotella sp.]|nr:hypothetical protein [Prevotella sp.]